MHLFAGLEPALIHTSARLNVRSSQLMIIQGNIIMFKLKFIGNDDGINCVQYSQI